MRLKLHVVWVFTGTDKTPCDSGFIYCGDFFMMEHPCVRNSTLCDGKNDCNTYNADESLCGECPANHCLNAGTCSLVNNVPTCK